MPDFDIEPISIKPLFQVPHPVLRQTWLDLTFLHWSFDPALVRPLVPSGLELDLWEGKCYVGLVPFLVTDMTLVNAPAAPWLSRFDETNVRTYVWDRYGRRGVWFFSLDAARLAAVIGARIGYALPYYWAKMSVHHEGEQVRYRSQRRIGPPGDTDIILTPGAVIEQPSALEVFLTARFRLFASRSGRLIRADINHPPWPLQQATVNRVEESLLRAAGLPDPQGPPLAHFSLGVTVLTGLPERI